MHQIGIGNHLQHGQVGVDFMQCLAQRRDHCENSVSVLSVEPDMEKSLPIVVLRQRHEHPRQKAVALDCVEMSANEADDFDVVRRTTLWRLGVANVLTDRVFVWKKFFRELFIDDPDTAPILVLAFSLSEFPAAQELYTQGVEIAGRDCRKESANARIGRLS